MIPADAERWQAARTLADLGELTALFLEGKLGETPSHLGVPDPETTELIPILGACCRAGFITHMSQPGDRDEYGVQRADVSGFASDDAFKALMNAVTGTDLIVTTSRALDEGAGWGPCITITTLANGEENTWDGGALSRSEIEDTYSRACHPDAVRALCGARQVTLIDPEWGRNDVLWPALETFVAARS